MRKLLLIAVLSLLACVLVAPAALAADIGYVSAGSFGAGPGVGDGELSGPKRVAVRDSDGAVFVVDADNDRVQVFDAGGTFVSQFGAGELDDPFGIAIDQATGEVYVSSAGNERIVKYDGTLTLDPAFVSPGKGAAAGRLGDFRAPLAFDQANDRLLVGDPGKDIVQRYTPAGAFVNDLDGATSPGGAFTDLKDIATAPNGDVLVIDGARVERFDAAGAHLATLAPAPAPGQVAVDPNTGNVLVTINTDPQSDTRIAVFVGGVRSSDLSVPTYGGFPTGIAARHGGDGRVHVAGDWVLDCCGVVGVFAFTPQELPEATIDPVGTHAAIAAELSGAVDPNGSATVGRFELSSDGGASWFGVDGDGDGDEDLGSGTAPVALSDTATGLTPDTAYQARVVATNPGGASIVSATTSFTTDDAPAPTVTLAAPELTGDSAALAGNVNPNGYQTKYHFDLSADGGATWTTLDPDQDGDEDAGAGSAAVDAAEQLTGLEPSVAYQVRLVATSVGGTTTVGPEQVTPAGNAPIVTTHLTTQPQHDSVRLTGYVDPNNQATTYRFEWGAGADALTHSLPAGPGASAGSGGGQVTAAQNLAGLEPDTAYAYRLVATNATGTTEGEVRSFTTRPAPAPRGPGVGADGDRTLELVSELDKHGNRTPGFVDFSDAGDRVLYKVDGGTATSTTGDKAITRQLAERTPSGWKQSSAMPERTQVPYPKMQLWGWSDDLTAFLVEGQPKFQMNGQVGPYGLFRFRHDAGEVEPGHTWVGPHEGVADRNIIQSTGDLGRSFAHANLPLAGDPPDHGPLGISELGGGQLYELKPEGAELIGALPGEALPYCGLGFSTVGVRTFRPRGHQVSEDGSRVFFAASGSDAPNVDDCWTPPELYMRQAGADGKLGLNTGATTTLVSGPPASGPARGAVFVQASPDGSQVFYATETRVSAEDHNDSVDLYRFRVGEGSACLTCVVADARITTRGGHPYGGWPVTMAEDGSRAYFSSRAVLAPGAVAGEENLYVLRVGAGEISFVAPVGAPNIDGLESPEGPLTTATPDGAVLVFAATRAGLDELTGTNTGPGNTQYYRYDDREESLTCVSCPVGPSRGSVPTFFGESGSGYEQLSRDGRSFVFKTKDSLVATDVNEDFDAYEWRDGRVGLLTTGTQKLSHPDYMYNIGITPSGRDVIVHANDLLPGADGVGQIYDARIGGGDFPAAAAPRPPCAGDECQGAPAAAPGLAGDPSSALERAGSEPPGARLSFGFSKLTAGQRAALVGGRVVALRVRATGRGRASVELRARLNGAVRRIAHGSKVVARPGATVGVPLRLSRAARRALARGDRLSASLVVRLAGVREAQVQTFALARKGR